MVYTVPASHSLSEVVLKLPIKGFIETASTALKENNMVCVVQLPDTHAPCCSRDNDNSNRLIEHFIASLSVTEAD